MFDWSVGFFFFFKQKTAYEMLRSLVGSEMCIRDSSILELQQLTQSLDQEVQAKNIKLLEAQDHASAFTEAVAALETERDDAISERDDAISERDDAISERDDAISERDGLSRQCAMLEDDMIQLRADRDIQFQQYDKKLQECISDATMAQDAEQRVATAERRDWEDEKSRLIQANMAASVALKELADERRLMATQITELKSQLVQAAQSDRQLRADLAAAADGEKKLSAAKSQLERDLVVKQDELGEMVASLETQMKERNLVLNSKLSAASRKAEAAIRRQLDLQEEKRRLGLQLQADKKHGARMGGGYYPKPNPTGACLDGGGYCFPGHGRPDAGDTVLSMVSHMGWGGSESDHALMMCRLELSQEAEARKAAQEGMYRAEALLEQHLSTMSSLGTPQPTRKSRVRNVLVGSAEQEQAMMEASMPAAPRQIRTIYRPGESWVTSIQDTESVSSNSWGEEIALDSASYTNG
eukprot:TRINITY_DN13845_c0_g1_i3.p1 TRINITY_DN13845_c0_g1~~TRINITY_DN13845_c0_g1_i3.p1  ORF type:complete len:471 (-),score=159.52 TRINITY_DN13845_c0_g1_i3:232-1644(-)